MGTLTVSLGTLTVSMGTLKVSMSILTVYGNPDSLNPWQSLWEPRQSLHGNPDNLCGNGDTESFLGTQPVSWERRAFMGTLTVSLGTQTVYENPYSLGEHRYGALTVSIGTQTVAYIHYNDCIRFEKTINHKDITAQRHTFEKIKNILTC
jgi:hypothetical protein